MKKILHYLKKHPARSVLGLVVITILGILILFPNLITSISNPIHDYLESTPRDSILGSDSLETFKPDGVTISSKPSRGGGLTTQDATRSWSYSAPNIDTARAAGQQILEHASADGWESEGSSLVKGTHENWTASATKKTSGYTLELLIYTESENTNSSNVVVRTAIRD